MKWIMVKYSPGFASSGIADASPFSSAGGETASWPLIKSCEGAKSLLNDATDGWPKSLAVGSDGELRFNASNWLWTGIVESRFGLGITWRGIFDDDGGGGGGWAKGGSWAGAGPSGGIWATDGAGTFDAIVDGTLAVGEVAVTVLTGLNTGGGGGGGDVILVGVEVGVVVCSGYVLIGDVACGVLLDNVDGAVLAMGDGITMFNVDGGTRGTPVGGVDSACCCCSMFGFYFNRKEIN